jgi:hypothetical protein
MTHVLDSVRKVDDHVFVALCGCGLSFRASGPDSAKRTALTHAFIAALPECPTPEKKAFMTRKRAYKVLRGVRMNGETTELPNRVYKCPCGYWHLTKQRRWRAS